MKADYNCEYNVSESEVESMIEPAHDFIEAIESLVANHIES